MHILMDLLLLRPLSTTETTQGLNGIKVRFLGMFVKIYSLFLLTIIAYEVAVL